MTRVSRVNSSSQSAHHGSPFGIHGTLLVVKFLITNESRADSFGQSTSSKLSKLPKIVPSVRLRVSDAVNGQASVHFLNDMGQARVHGDHLLKVGSHEQPETV